MDVVFLPKACLHVACVVQQKDARQWFAELSVDMDKVRVALWLRRNCHNLKDLLYVFFFFFGKVIFKKQDKIPFYYEITEGNITF